mmetsp:Transcript_60768/g.69451  ORF Transcript_60768/g.69451 Transcript_60768/m.69451 type:complete len:480 (+) Transcript_60768:123-1562(+)
MHQLRRPNSAATHDRSSRKVVTVVPKKTNALLCDDSVVGRSNNSIVGLAIKQVSVGNLDNQKMLPSIGKSGADASNNPVLQQRKSLSHQLWESKLKEVEIERTKAKIMVSTEQKRNIEEQDFIKETYERTITNLRENERHRMEMMEEQFQKMQSDQSLQYRNETTAIKQKYEQQITGLKEEIEAMHSKHQSELKELQMKSEEKIRRIENDHVDRIEENRRNYLEKLEFKLEQEHQRLGEKLEEYKCELKEEQERQLSAIIDKLAEEKAEISKSRSDEIQRLKLLVVQKEHEIRIWKCKYDNQSHQLKQLQSETLSLESELGDLQDIINYNNSDQQPHTTTTSTNSTQTNIQTLLKTNSKSTQTEAEGVKKFSEVKIINYDDDVLRFVAHLKAENVKTVEIVSRKFVDIVRKKDGQIAGLLQECQRMKFKLEEICRLFGMLRDYQPGGDDDHGFAVISRRSLEGRKDIMEGILEDMDDVS